MASYQNNSAIEICHGHKREQSQDSGAYIDWNSEDSSSPVCNSDGPVNDDFITVVSVENGGNVQEKREETSFVTILAIGDTEANSKKSVSDEVEEEVLIYRLPGERLGFGLKFEGGTNTAENVKRLFIQSSAPDSPASRAKCSWGSLVEGDEILKIDSHVVNKMTRLDCVRCLKESSVVIKLLVSHKSEKSIQRLSANTENSKEMRVSSSPMVVSAEMKKNVPPPPPPVPPRKIARKSSVLLAKEETALVNPPEAFCDLQNGSNPMPKMRTIQTVANEGSKNLSKFVIRVPQKGSQASADFSKDTAKRTASDLKLVPPEAIVHLDLLALEDSRNCESESDDTGSTVSTVVGLSSIPNTTNSSFSDLRSSASSFCDSTNPSTPTSEVSAPIFELSKMLSPFENTHSSDFLFSKLINGKDQDDERSSNCADDVAPLQPPLSFQDAPLSYGNEEMRANISEHLDMFDDENIKSNHVEIMPDLESPGAENKAKDKVVNTTKKPSLIPRLAKSIGLLSPPKPSPRKETKADGSKSRFNKKKLLPPSSVDSQNSQIDAEYKTAKSSIPYLKKKKGKHEDGKKSGKSEKKSKRSDGSIKAKDISFETNLNLFNTESQTDIGKSFCLPSQERKASEEKIPTSPEPIDASLCWEVPDLKKSNSEDDLMQLTKEIFGDDENLTESVDESDYSVDHPHVSESHESHFTFPWNSTKPLETIGEDEEDGPVECKQRCSDEENAKILSPEEKKTGAKESQCNDRIIPEESGKIGSEKLKATCKEKNLNGKVAAEEEEGKKTLDAIHESEANGPKQKTGLCNNHVLVKLDNDSLKVVKNVDLKSSDGEVTGKAMVPVVSTTIGLVASTSAYNRMPPDGHEFPQKYSEAPVLKDSTMPPETSKSESVDSALPPLPTSEPPSARKKYAGIFDGDSNIQAERKHLSGRSTTESGVVKPPRNSFWRQDEKSEKSVRDKIAMFSSVSDSGAGAANGSGKLSKYKSSDDVFYDEDPDGSKNFQNGKVFSRSVMTLDKVSTGSSPYMKKPLYADASLHPRSLDYSNRTQSSMDLTSSSSSSSAYSSSCSPDSSLSSNSSYLGYSSTLPRKKNRRDENKANARTKEAGGIARATSFSVHGRSQSLLDVNPSPYKSRYLSETSHEDGSKPGSLNLLIEQRRKNLTKLRGLVIPEKLSDAVSSQPIVDLPEIRSRDLILNAKVPDACKEKSMTAKWSRTSLPETTTGPKVTPMHLWDMQSKTPNIPKYSPAFKRKSISVFGAKELLPLNSKKDILARPVSKSDEDHPKAPLKPPRNVSLPRQNSICDDSKYQDAMTSVLSEPEISFPVSKSSRMNERPTDIYVPRRKLQGKYRTHSDFGRSEEDSDNDSAVSSSRSSISHGFSPPASPLLDGQYQTAEDSGHPLHMSPDRNPVTRTLSSDTTVSAISTNSTPMSESQASVGSCSDGGASDGSNKRILKAQSVEAINRKNVLASAKYSRGFDAKSGSPLIQRKFAKDIDEEDADKAELVYAINRNGYDLGKYPNGSAKQMPIKSQTEKIAFITDVVDMDVVLNGVDKKKLEKSESLPLEPPIKSGQTTASRKTSVPYGYTWMSDNNWNQTNVKPVEQVPDTFKESPAGCNFVDESPAKPEKDLTLMRSRARNGPKCTTDGDDAVEKGKETGKVESKTGSERIANGKGRSISVNDIRRAFEKADASASSAGRLAKGGSLTSPASTYYGLNGTHVRVSSLDSTASEDGPYGFSSNLQREQFGSITSLASSTSLISPQELQLLIEEANQTLEESGSLNGGSSPNNHDVLVIILHRDTVGGSVGITLAGGADYESKEITVHKVLAGSPADRDGRIQKGDRILSINGKSMKGVTHRESLAILKSPRLEVVLVVSRLKMDAGSDSVNSDDSTPVQIRHGFFSGTSRPPRILEKSGLDESDEMSDCDIPRGPPVALVLVKDGAGLGFSLEGGKDCPTGNKPLVIKKIFTGGAAEKCGQLKAGDELVNVNGIDVSVMSRIEAWKLMKQLPDGNVTITVKRAVEDRSAVVANGIAA